MDSGLALLAPKTTPDWLERIRQRLDDDYLHSPSLTELAEEHRSASATFAGRSRVQRQDGDRISPGTPARRRHAQTRHHRRQDPVSGLGKRFPGLELLRPAASSLRLPGLRFRRAGSQRVAQFNVRLAPENGNLRLGRLLQDFLRTIRSMVGRGRRPRQRSGGGPRGI